MDLYNLMVFVSMDQRGLLLFFRIVENDGAGVEMSRMLFVPPPPPEAWNMSVFVSMDQRAHCSSGQP